MQDLSDISPAFVQIGRCALRITFRSATPEPPSSTAIASASAPCTKRRTAAFRLRGWDTKSVSPNTGPKQHEEIAVIAAALLQYTSILGAQEL